MVDGIRLEPGVRVFALISGNFIFGDVLEALADKGIAEYRTMTIQTLSMSQDNIDSLRNVIERCFEMERLRIVLSDYYYAHERKADGLVPYLYDRLDVDDVLDVAFASVHTKIVTFETVEGLKVVMDGSANLRSSRNVEQLRIECDADLHDRIEAFADRIFEAYSTINKGIHSPRSVRGGRLWEAVTKKERMASGSESGGGGGRKGILSAAFTRGRKTLSGQDTMSARQAYRWARKNGASRKEAREYTLNYMSSTR